MNKKKFNSTTCVHAGEHRDAQGAIHTPLYNHSTFAFSSTEAIVDVVRGAKPGNLYTRYGMNPTIRATEEKLASIEGAESALAFSSGMAAEAALFLAYCIPGDRILCLGDVYGGTFELLDVNLRKLGIETDFLLGSELEQLAGRVSERTRILFCETPTNPNIEVFDIAALSSFCHERGIILVVDNTFASPVNQQPLQLGADLVIHSATKYLGGHSDLTAGAVMGAESLVVPLWQWRKNLGQMIAPEVAFLLARSIKTLICRVEAQNDSASRIAHFLQSHPRVSLVNYPGLPDHPQHALACRQMRGFGGMLSFNYDGDGQQTSAMVDKVRIFSIAPSLGGVESLVTQPVTTTHFGMPVDERRRRNISDQLVRLSIGLEHPDDLIADLSQALG